MGEPNSLAGDDFFMNAACVWPAVILTAMGFFKRGQQRTLSDGYYKAAHFPAFLASLKMVWIILVK